MSRAFCCANSLCYFSPELLPIKDRELRVYLPAAPFAELRRSKVGRQVPELVMFGQLGQSLRAERSRVDWRYVDEAIF